MAQHIRVQLFGPPQIVLADGTPTRLDSRKALALLAYLARQQRPPTRAALAALLWGDLPEARGRRNLSRELTQLTALFPASMEADYRTVGWNGALAWVDAAAAAQLLHAAPPVPAPALAEAVALYRGPFMAGFALDDCAEFESWLMREREFWQQQITRALERLIADAMERGAFEPAQQHARRWLALEPWQEDVHRTLMLLLARTGQRGAALAQFEACRRALAHELDMEPARETVALAEQIRAGALEPLAAQHARVAGGMVALAERTAPAPAALPPAAAPPAPHWSPVPAVDRFYGRAVELAALHKLLDERRCRVVAVLGMGGIGKTTLAAQAARQLAPGFDAVVWRSLLNAPPLPELLRSCLQALATPPAAIPEPLDDQLALLLECLRRQRCLIVLDNAESLLQGEAHAGQYRAGAEVYGQLLRMAGTYEHQSCLLLTSREPPLPLPQLGAETPLVQVLRLDGLDDDSGLALLAAHGVASARAAPTLVARYSGNPLALALVAELIHETYAGDLDAFLGAEAVLFEDIRAVLDQQWARLSALEQDLLLWLAVCRQHHSAATLRALLVPASSGGAVLDALRSLQRRSLIEPAGAQFGLQNVVLEYVSARLIDAVCEEIAHGAWRRFQSHALMQATALEYVRLSQVRLLLAPVAQQLAAQHGQAGLHTSLLRGLAALRNGAAPAHGYAGGNALNLLLHVGADLRGADFSHLSVWQADLRRARLPGVSFAHADLRGSVFTETLRDSYVLDWSPDGALVAACVGNGELRLWRTSDWQLVGRCDGPSTFVWQLVFSPASDRLASCGDDGVVRVWDVATCQAIYTLRGHHQAVQALDWSPDGRMLITGSRDQTVRIWHVERAAPLHELRGHADRIRWAAWSPDGTLVATASHDHTVMLWDAHTGKRRVTLAHPAPVHTLAWHPAGTLLATSSGDHQVRVWDLSTREITHTLANTRSLVIQLAYSPDGTRIAGSGRPAVQIWHAASGALHTTLLGHTHSVACVAWNPDGDRLASRSETNIRVWDLASEQTLTVLQGTSLGIYQLAISADERSIATSHADELVRIWDRASGAVTHTLQGHTDAIIGVSFSPDGGTLATAGHDGTLRIWDTARGTVVRTMRAAQTQIVSFARSADGALIATGCHDGTVWLWDWQRGQARAVLRGHTLPVTCVAFSPAGSVLFTSSEDGTLCRWDLQSEQVLDTLPIEGRSAYALVFDVAGTTLYGACNDAFLRSWDLATGQISRRLPVPAAITRLDRSPDGTKLVSRGEGVVCIWDVVSGENMLTHRHVHGFGPVRFIDAGRAFVTCSDNGTIRFWDAQTGTLLRTLPTPGPYAGMDITGASGLSEVQRVALHALGAVEPA